MVSKATINTSQGTVKIQGYLDCSGVEEIWSSAKDAATSAKIIDVSAVTGMDSVGLAMIALLVAQSQRARVIVPTDSTGFDDLRAAYRMSATFDFDA